MLSDFLLIFRLAPLRKNPVTRIIVQDNYRSISRVVTGAGTIARQIFVSSNFLSPLVSSNFNSTTVPSWKMDRGALTRYPGGEGGTVRNSNLNLTWDERRRTRYVLISCPWPTTVQSTNTTLNKQRGFYQSNMVYTSHDIIEILLLFIDSNKHYLSIVNDTCN